MADPRFTFSKSSIVFHAKQKVRGKELYVLSLWKITAFLATGFLNGARKKLHAVATLHLKRLRSFHAWRQLWKPLSAAEGAGYCCSACLIAALREISAHSKA